MTDDRAQGRPTVWLPAEKLILASASPTRRTLLESASIPVEVVTADIDERGLEAEHPELDPPQLAVHLAEAKASSVSQRHRPRIVVGADQVLELDGTVLHKPGGIDDATRHLRSLSGRTHVLHSAVAIARDGRIVDSFHDSALMSVRHLDEEAISAYLELTSDHGIVSSVGAYQIERFGIHLFSEIEGDQSTILGLPLIPLLQRLRTMGFLSF